MPIGGVNERSRHGFWGFSLKSLPPPGSLVVFVGFGLPSALTASPDKLGVFLAGNGGDSDASGFLCATALDAGRYLC